MKQSTVPPVPALFNEWGAYCLVVEKVKADQILTTDEAKLAIRCCETIHAALEEKGGFGSGQQEALEAKQNLALARAIILHHTRSRQRTLAAMFDRLVSPQPGETLAQALERIESEAVAEARGEQLNEEDIFDSYRKAVRN